MLRLYDCLSSGNAYKVRLFLRQLGISFARVEVDVMKGETRTPEFLRRNPNGRVPVLELESGAHLPESNAILYYLAEGTPFLPDGRWERAQVLQWMFFEQYSHEPNIAVARFWIRFVGVTADKRALLEQKQQLGYAALGVMEGHLAKRAFFVADQYSIADIALYAYTHVAGEGGFDLGRFPAVHAWLERVRSQPGHTPISQE